MWTACVASFIFETALCVRNWEVFRILKSCGIGCIKVNLWHTRTSNWRDAHALSASTVTHRFFESSLSEDAIPIVDDLNSFVANGGRHIMQNSTITFFSPNYLNKTMLVQVAECMSAIYLVSPRLSWISGCLYRSCFMFRNFTTISADNCKTRQFQRMSTYEHIRSAIGPGRFNLQCPPSVNAR